MCDWTIPAEHKIPGDTDDNECKETEVDGDDRCVFHRKTPAAVEEFRLALSQQVAGTRNKNSPYDFTGYNFPCGVVLTHGAVGVSSEDYQAPTETAPKEVLKISFREAQIHGAFCAKHARFVGDLTFREAKVDGVADFRNLDVEGWVSFAFAEFAKRVYPQRWRVDFTLGGRHPNISPFLRERRGLKLNDIAHASDVWRFARLAFDLQGEKDRADAAFYFERLAQLSPMRLTDRKKGGKVFRFLERWTKRVGATLLVWLPDAVLLRWTTAYGASIGRVLATWLVVIGSVGAAFSAAPSLIARSVETIWSLENWVIGFQFSVTTFTTLGLGDIAPTELLGRALTSVEAILGGIMMALTVLVIGRKFMR